MNAIRTGHKSQVDTVIDEKQFPLFFRDLPDYRQEHYETCEADPGQHPL